MFLLTVSNKLQVGSVNFTVESYQYQLLHVNIHFYDQFIVSQGIPGSAGEKGDAGDAGPRGQKGLSGLQGLKGAKGRSVSYGRGPYHSHNPLIM